MVKGTAGKIREMTMKKNRKQKNKIVGRKIISLDEAIEMLSKHKKIIEKDGNDLFINLTNDGEIFISAGCRALGITFLEFEAAAFAGRTDFKRVEYVIHPTLGPLTCFIAKTGPNGKPKLNETVKSIFGWEVMSDCWVFVGLGKHCPFGDSWNAWILPPCVVIT